MNYIMFKKITHNVKMEGTIQEDLAMDCAIKHGFKYGKIFNITVVIL